MANDPCRCRGKRFPGGEVSAVREEVRESETGSAHPAFSCRFRTRTGKAEITMFRQRRGQTGSSRPALAKVRGGLRSCRLNPQTRRPTTSVKRWR